MMMNNNNSHYNNAMNFHHQTRQQQQSQYSSHAQQGSKAVPPLPNVVFVGNLSYFCEETHLFELFNEYGHVEHVRIVRNDNNTRSLMFGFVTMASPHEAREMERLLNNHLFMGRRMRVAISERRFDARTITGNDGIQVHVSFCSFFTEQTLRRPTEGFLRKVFLDFGILVDVSVKEYRIYQEQCMQEGYGFLTLSSYDDAVNIAASFQNIAVDGISLTCSLTHQNNPHSKKHRSPSPGFSSLSPSAHGEGLPPMPPRPLSLSPSVTSHHSHGFGLSQQVQNIYPAFAPHFLSSSVSLSSSPLTMSPSPLSLNEMSRYAGLTSSRFENTNHNANNAGNANSSIGGLGESSPSVLGGITANANAAGLSKTASGGGELLTMYPSLSLDSFASSSGSGRESVSSDLTTAVFN